MKVYVLDIETTGLDPEKDEVVAVGYSEVLEFRPRVVVRKPGEPEEFLLSRTLKELREADVIVGYNVQFDVDFLKRRAGFFPKRVIDLLPLVKHFFGKQYRLKDITQKIFPFVENDDANGSDIPELWMKGDVRAVQRHLYLDIKRTWLLANFFAPWIRAEKGDT